jgi:hypothetical protein
LSGALAKRREMAIRRIKIVVPVLFALGFLFFTGITVVPLAGMPGPPLSPAGGVTHLLIWIGVACAVGGLFALFSALLIAVSASADDI